MSDDKSRNNRPHPPAEHSPQGGDKDTNDLSNIKDVQKTGMDHQRREVDDLPQGVQDDTQPPLPKS